MKTLQQLKAQMLESSAVRAEYEALTGNFVTEVGFCLHDDLPCGVSPDGLIDDDGTVTVESTREFLTGFMDAFYDYMLRVMAVVPRP